MGEVDLIAHPPVLTSTDNAWQLFYVTEAIRVLEAGEDHYMGMMSGNVTGPRGIGYAPGRVAFSIPDRFVVAHELGHNMSLLHAPCGGPLGIDPEYPRSDDGIGAWGYDFRDGGSLVRPSTADIMSYCDPHWIGEYGFTKAARFRLEDEEAGQGASAPTTSLLLWGGVDAEEGPFLEPAFVVDVPPVMPASGGDYRLIGTDADGGQLFPHDIDMREVPDGEGHRAFALALPVQPGWAGALAGITLADPRGRVTLDGDSDESMTILRDTRSGQVRAILRGIATDANVQMLGGGHVSSVRGMELLVSSGVPDAAAWQR